MEASAMIGSQDLMVGLVIALIFFGAKKLPELAGSLGKSMKEFKKGVSGDAEGEAAATAASLPAVIAETPRTCASCHTVQEPDWSHCPRCGTPVSAPTDGSKTGV
jgi:sec-independent protein translocase protein TatA